VTSWLIMFFFVVDKVSIRLFSETESHVTVASAKMRYSPIALLDPVLAASVLPKCVMCLIARVRMLGNSLCIESSVAQADS